jgi:hypothetical protein
VQLGGLVHVYSTGSTGDLIEIVNDGISGHPWNFYDQTVGAGGGVALAGAPGPLLIGGTPHVYGRAAGSNDLVEFVADHLGGRIWNAYDQTLTNPGLPTLSGDPMPALINGIPHIYLTDGNSGDLVEVVADHLMGRTWNAYDQTAISGAPRLQGNPTVVLVDGAQYGQPGTQVPEVFERASGTLAVVAADHRGGHIWNAYDVTRLSGGSDRPEDPVAIVNGGAVEVLALVGGPPALQVSGKQTGPAAIAGPPIATPGVAAAPNGTPRRGQFEQLAGIERRLAR